MGLPGLFGALEKQIVVQPVARGQGSAIDVREAAEQVLVMFLGPRNGFHAVIAPAVVKAPVAQIGSPFGALTHGVIPFRSEQIVERFARTGRRRLRGLRAGENGTKEN